MDDLDRIERHIDIDAAAERVWELVARPGWFCNTGRVVSNPVLRTEGGEGSEGSRQVLAHPEYGDLRFETVRLDPPRYAAFRWLSEPTPQVPEPATLVEFRIDDRPDGGVRLHVTESGFAGLGKDAADWLRHREENDRGWVQELGAARDFLAPEVAERSVDVAAAPDEVRSWLPTSSALAPTASFTVTASGPGSVLTVRETGFEDTPARDAAVTRWEAWLGELARRTGTPTSAR